ncbi:MAG: O-antigen ligase family protein [Oscillospiraceae bacterium]|nr:O-antigen ligase family protein [Oscillospiraceae bacterium]
MAKTHKTIFGTTEKSNFILNMTNDQFNKLASVLFTIGFSLIFVLSAVTELMSKGKITVATYDWKIVPSVSLGITGILAISIFIIALIKQTLSRKQIVASVITLVLAVCLYISYVNAVTTVQDYTAFLGFRYGRYEGLMVYLSYLFIFLGSMTINRESTVRNIFRVISVITVLQSIWSGLQFIPSFPSFYYKVPYIMQPVMLPSGTTGSPAYLATFMACGLAIAVFSVPNDSNRIFSCIHKTAVLGSAFFLTKTQTLLGYISITVIVAAALADHLRNRKSESKNSSPLVFLFTGLAAAAALIIIKGFAVYDGEVIWQDGCLRLGAFGQYSSSIEGAINIHSLSEVYPYLWGKAYEIIKQFPVTGIGPDAFIFSQRKGSFNDVPLSVDRPYSEYLYYAATFGIPAAVSLAAAFFCSAANGVVSAAKNRSWVFRAPAVIAVLYTASAVITNSTATVTPFIWFMLGTCCCTLKDNDKA